MSPRYVPLLRLGIGARADVYLGRLTAAEGFRTLVVMKRALGEEVSDEEARQGLVNEAKIALACRHPHVVSALELTEIREGLVLITEYLSGVTLGALIRHLHRYGGAVLPPLAARLVADAAHGLAHVHRAMDPLGRAMRLVHGDISPDNLLLGEDAFTRVTDFGSAHPARAEENPAPFFGTPPFCSPEQIQGRAVGQASDVFSLGVVLHSLLLGGSPVSAESEKEVLDAVAGGRFEPLPARTPKLLKRLLKEMTSHSPEDRPKMVDVAERLEDLCVSRGGSREQLRSFLEAEMGRALARRRSRLTEIEEGGGQIGAGRSTATFALLDSLLDMDLPELAGTRVDWKQRA